MEFLPDGGENIDRTVSTISTISYKWTTVGSGFAHRECDSDSRVSVAVADAVVVV